MDIGYPYWFIDKQTKVFLDKPFKNTCSETIQESQPLLAKSFRFCPTLVKPGLWSWNSNFRLRFHLQAYKVFDSRSGSVSVSNIWQFLAEDPKLFGQWKLKNTVSTV